MCLGDPRYVKCRGARALRWVVGGAAVSSANNLGSDKAGLGKAGAGAGSPVRHFMQLLIIPRANIQTQSAHTSCLHPSAHRYRPDPQASPVHEATQIIPRRRLPTTLLALPFPPPSPRSTARHGHKRSPAGLRACAGCAQRHAVGVKPRTKRAST